MLKEVLDLVVTLLFIALGFWLVSWPILKSLASILWGTL